MGNSSSKEEESKKRLDTFKRKEAQALEAKLKEPWRTSGPGGGWTSEFRSNLVSEIRSYKPYGEEIEYSKLVILGPIFAGKSSFISSIASIDKNKISQPALAGGAVQGSFTNKLMQYIPKESLAGEYRLMDTMGIEDMDDEGLNIQDIIYLMEGNVKVDYEFNPKTPIVPQDNPKFIHNPTLNDKPQCIVMLVDSGIIDTDAFSQVFKQKLRKLVAYIKQKGIPTVIVATKIDELCEAEGIKITDIYTNRRIRDVVTKASQLFGVPEMNVYPVQCYSKELFLDDNMDILLLLALRGILNIANDRLERLADQKR